MSIARAERFTLVVGSGGWTIPGTAVVAGGLLAVAFALRFFGLGELPLSPGEAARALEARSLNLATHAAYSGAPLVVNLMSAWFVLFSQGDGQARAPLALAGVALCLTPWLYRPWIGRAGAAVVGAVLVVSPMGVLASRTVDGAALAALALSVGVASALRACRDDEPRWLIVLGVSLAIGLGTGVDFLGAALAAVLGASLCPPVRSLVSGPDSKRWAIRAVVVALLTAIVLDTRFLTRPPGLYAGLIGPLPAWLGGISLTRRALGPLLLGLAHEPLLLVLAVAGAVSACRTPFGRFLGCWSLLALLLGGIGPGSVLATIATAIVPLALLAGCSATRLVRLAPLGRSGVLTAAICLLVPLIWLVLALNLAPRDGPLPFTPLLLALAIAIVVVLVASSWLRLNEVGVAVIGALLFGLGIVQGSLLGRLDFGGFERGAPIFGTEAARPELRVFEQQARDWWRQEPTVPIEVDASLRPVVEWSLRDGPPVRWIQSAPVNPARSLLGDALAGARPEGRWVRVVVAERYGGGLEDLKPRTLWSWLAQRQPLMKSVSDAILYTR
ncbi:MAG: hypothetical protein IT307_14815 [Chloroflexi bacterium]|nr:hypothetical protein [Chloroflexota bacterium]